MMKNKGFTLIELLIVVSIIAILAAIAVPNFLEAQTRAKISRVKADLKTISSGMELYRCDYNAYPYCNPEMDHSYLSDITGITTPIAYMQALPVDIFSSLDDNESNRYYRYYPSAYWKRLFPEIRLQGMMWIVMSNGPDQDIDITRENAQDAIDGDFWMVYNPTNGTRSSGDVIFTNQGFLGNTL